MSSGREVATRSPALLALLGCALASVPDWALAHSGTGEPGGFLAGFRHPISGPDHLLAMVSVGLWGAFLGRPLIYLLPIIFPMVMAGGAVLAMAGLRLPAPEVGIALSVLILGGCIALALRAPIWAASAVVATFALFHGYAHGKELPSAADPIAYSAGFVLATGMLHLLGILAGSLKATRAGLLATRFAGGLIAASGLWFLAAAVAP